jgi:S-adenosylmethionine/arginine decarboxylase-like enzyme
MKAWGIHSLINLRKCCPDAIRSRTNILRFGTALVKGIDMVAYGKPMLEHFGKDDKMGFTFVQLIETSNIVAHFCEETDDAYIDIFSCKEYDIKVAEYIIRSHFKPHNLSVTVVERSAPCRLNLLE